MLNVLVISSIIPVSAEVAEVVAEQVFDKR